jgi:hypothetical protein
MLYFVFASTRGDRRREGESTGPTFDRGPSFNSVATRGARRRRGVCTSWRINDSTNKSPGGGARHECDLLGLGVRPAERFDVGHPSAKILSRFRCWITRSWRIVSHTARMWAGGVGGISSFMESRGGGATGVLRDNQMIGHGLMSFGAANE